MIIDIYLYIYTHTYKEYKDNRYMAIGIRLHFCRERLKGLNIFFEWTGELRCLFFF
jgi:hypothetical protein